MPHMWELTELRNERDDLKARMEKAELERTIDAEHHLRRERTAQEGVASACAERDAAIRERDEALEEASKLHAIMEKFGMAMAADGTPLVIPCPDCKRYREQLKDAKYIDPFTVKTDKDRIARLVGLLKEARDILDYDPGLDAPLAFCHMVRRIDAEIGEKP